MIPSSHQLSLKLIERCPSCQSTVPLMNIHILNETDTNITAHMACPHCYSKYLMYIVTHPQGLIGNAILTDLNYEETIALIGQGPMSEDEFLAIYKLTQSADLINSIKFQSHNNRN